MISLAVAKQLALSFPEAEERSHFEKPDFRIRNKIFAVLHTDRYCMVIKLSPVDQSVFCAFDASIIYAVAGGWGRQGWTTINLKKVKKAMLADALATAWKTVAPPALVKKHFPNR